MIKYLLFPVTVIYYFLSCINRLITVPKKLYVPVISIGNITWGGSGKTPTVIETAKFVQSLGKRPVVLSRGYGRKNKEDKNVIVTDGENILADIFSSGDEPYMTANQIKCPVVIGADRYESALIAKKFNPDVFILDDGFQHWKLKKDLEVVCVNSLNPFGNGMLIPSGILREKKSALKRADIVILTNCNLCEKEKLNLLKKEISGITGTEPVEVSAGNFFVSNMFDNVTVENLEEFKAEKSFVLLSAIGSPKNFENTVLSLGMKIKDKFIYTDHHKYNENEIFDIINNLQDNEILLTTAKDAVKIKEAVDENVQRRIYVFNISLSFDSGKEIFENKIKETLINYKL